MLLLLASGKCVYSQSPLAVLMETSAAAVIMVFASDTLNSQVHIKRVPSKCLSAAHTSGPQLWRLEKLGETSVVVLGVEEVFRQNLSNLM